MIKKHKSTVMKVAWHPNSQLLATGSSDFKARVFSSYVRQIDDKQETAGFAVTAFGDECWEGSAGGWVDTVSWSPSGDILGFGGHDSSVTFVDFSGGVEAATPQVLKFGDLPFEDSLFCSEKCFVGVGHSMNPLVFRKGGSGWVFERKLEEKSEKKEAEKATSGVAAARALFQNKTDKGQDGTSASDKLETTHEASISCIKSTCSDLTVKSFTTSGTDGKLVYWKLDELNMDMAALGM